MTRNLNTISLLHYVYGGLKVLMGLVLGAAFWTFGAMRRVDFEQSGAILQTVGVILAAFILFWGIMICLSGKWISPRRNRTGSMVLAGFCCLSFPLGTALGIFTFVALSDEEVKRAYLAG